MNVLSGSIGGSAQGQYQGGVSAVKSSPMDEALGLLHMQLDTVEKEFEALRAALDPVVLDLPRNAEKASQEAPKPSMSRIENVVSNATERLAQLGGRLSYLRSCLRV